MPKVKSQDGEQLAIQYTPGGAQAEKGRQPRVLEIGPNPVQVFADERDFLLGMYAGQIVEVKDEG